MMTVSSRASATERDRADGEPAPAQGEARNDVGEPMDIEEDAAGGDPDRERDGEPCKQ